LTAPAHLDAALDRARAAFEEWSSRPATERAAVLERAADGFEAQMQALMSIIVREGGRTYADAVAEVREAADFCRYYAMQARTRLAAPLSLPGPAGEKNTLGLHGRGVFACISPWNFPLAIFTGQVAAALAAGNTVIAKPAEQTPLTALRALELLRAAGVPADAAIGVFGDGEAVGAPLVADPRVAGVAFTGSVDTARAIERALAARSGPIVPLIAETGGLNAMLVDSSALPEQVVDDVIISAFQSAGQRCSALRILFLEAGCAPRVLSLLAGAMRELKVGDPIETDTDVGPIIDAPARAALAAHSDRLRGQARLISETPLPQGLPQGHWFAPIAFETGFDGLPQAEIFGPVLHVCVLGRGDLDRALEWIRASGYGLTLGIHSRVQRFIDRVMRGTRVGNVYVNRSMIGAVVGVQPFGGEGLSGTGFKAGGPNYLLRFATERTLSINTAAVGGVTELLQPGAGT
jgi:RHH-type proline utilization regulon transcriptional repressor/proline dehydrogenase/delta 1-pyrroline-5-carboxylate dehydrogenase